ncbi:MAG: hypothetical protein F7C36_00160 [Desulfurococcales archaeon]|nr:hypothetical protein [Desulfurococcales archaeon]
MQKYLSLAIVALILLSIVSLAIITVYSSQGISESVRILIDEKALKKLGVGENYVVALALLTIPGVGIFEASGIIHDSRGLSITFDKYSAYRDIIMKTSLDDDFKTYLPTVFLQLRDYDNSRVYNIIISSYTVSLLDYAKSKNYRVDPNDFISVKEESPNNWLSLLESNLITISENDMNIMIMAKLASVEKLNKLDQYMLYKYNIIDQPAISEVTPADLEEFPFPGANYGIYQEVNWTKYYEYTRSIPKWWINGFVESDGDPDIEEDYQRFVKDLLVSRYYIEKTRYSEINQFLPILRNLIATENNNPNAPYTSINMIRLEEFVGTDLWNNSKANSFEFVNIPIFRYYINNLVSTTDANNFIISISLDYFEVTAAVSGLLFAGHLMDTSSSINIGTTHISEVVTLGESTKRMGTLWINNAVVTFGEDVILVEWIIDENSSDTYYIVTPVVTVVPLYTVSYGANSFSIEFSSSSDPFYDEWGDGLGSTLLSYQADRNPNNYPVEIWRMLVSLNSSDAQMSYDALIDSPPLMGVLLDMLADETEHPVAELIYRVYSLLSSIGYINVEVSASAVTADARILQTNSLSGDIDVSMQVYYPTARYFAANYDSNNEFFNLVYITLTYSQTTPPPCTGIYCVTSQANS